MDICTPEPFFAQSPLKIEIRYIILPGMRRLYEDTVFVKSFHTPQERSDALRTGELIDTLP